MNETKPSSDQKYMNEQQAAKVLQIGPATLKKERLDGLIDYNRIVGGRIRYTMEQIHDYVVSHPMNAKKVERVRATEN